MTITENQNQATNTTTDAQQSNILLLYGRGCNFFSDEEINKTSDVGNYRVCTMGENIKGKNGKTYFLEFTRGDVRTVRETNKRTGQPLKHPIIEIVMKNALHVDTQYSCMRNGLELSFRDLETEKRYNTAEGARPYTRKSILEVVNEISIDHFDKLAIIYYPDLYRAAGYREKYAIEHGTPKAYEDGGRVLVCFEYSEGDHYQDANGATWDTVRRAWVC